MESAVVIGSLNFMKRLELYKTTKPYSIAIEIESWTGDVPRSNFQQDCVDVTIRDIRGREGQFTFEKNGFALLDFSSSMTYEDFEDTAKLENVYAQELGACLLQYFQATSVRIFSILPFNLELIDGKRYGAPYQQSNRPPVFILVRFSGP
ncbi:hypothetical protein Hte_011012 [Hypoxylon texense]